MKIKCQIHKCCYNTLTTTYCTNPDVINSSTFIKDRLHSCPYFVSRGISDREYNDACDRLCG